MSVQISRTPNGGLYVVIDGVPEGIIGLNNVKFKQRGATSITIINAKEGILFTFLYTDISLIAGAVRPNMIGDGILKLTDLFAGGTAWAAPAKANQTITFAQPADRVHTAPAFSANASTTSGLPLAYVSSDPTKATVHPTSGLITPVAAGTTDITVSQAGDANYNVASQMRTITLT